MPNDTGWNWPILIAQATVADLLAAAVRQYRELTGKSVWLGWRPWLQDRWVTGFFCQSVAGSHNPPELAGLWWGICLPDREQSPSPAGLTGPSRRVQTPAGALWFWTSAPSDQEYSTATPLSEPIAEFPLDSLAHLCSRLPLMTNGPGSVWADSSRLAALAEFAAGAGHEINNPLATIIGRVRLAMQATGAGELASRHLVTAISQAYRVRDMIGDVMLFARPPSPQFEVIQLVSLLQEVVIQLTAEQPATRIQLPQDATPTSLQADPTQIRVALSELLRNAVEAIQRGPSGSASITIQLHQTEKRVSVCIRDAGGGWTPTDWKHLFDPFYSGRQAGRGLGFGLCKAAQIIALHGGAILIREGQPTGTEVEVTLPLNPLN